MKKLTGKLLLCLCVPFITGPVWAGYFSCRPLDAQMIDAVIMHKQEILQQQPQQRKKSLLRAVRDNDFALVKELLEQGANINQATRKTKTTPLMYAAYNLNEQMVDLLIEETCYPINLSAIDIDGNTPIGYVYAALGTLLDDNLSEEEYNEKKQIAARIIKKLKALPIEESCVDLQIGGSKFGLHN